MLMTALQVERSEGLFLQMQNLIITLIFLITLIGFYLVYLSLRILASRINRLFIELEKLKSQHMFKS